jgi:hypothetical protein
MIDGKGARSPASTAAIFTSESGEKSGQRYRQEQTGHEHKNPPVEACSGRGAVRWWCGRETATPSIRNRHGNPHSQNDDRR